jgi:hypothetical protein
MTISKNTMATLLAAAGMATLLVAGPVTPSLAATKSFHHTQTYHSRANKVATKRFHQAQTYHSRAYNAWGSIVPRVQTYDSGAYNAWASAVPRVEQRPGAWFAHGAPDDPPGSAFQTYGVDQSMGYVR